MDPTTNGADAAASVVPRRPILNRVSPRDIGLEIKDPVDATAKEQAKAILDELLCRNKTESSKISSTAVQIYQLRQVAHRFGDIPSPTAPITISRAACQAAYEALSDHERLALGNMHRRIAAFAAAQRRSVSDMTMDIPGGQAGHTVSPCRVAGCYAPGGRYPLPSSVLMTAVTARAAGCETVLLASPNPAPITLAAAFLAKVDVFLCVGGAQAIACLAYGVSGDDDNNNNGTTITTTTPPCDVICGPGNKWVTAAKSIVSGKCGIDMLAGPSEVLVICDATANATVVAADLIAQAEHDVVARAILLCTCPTVLEAVDEQVAKQMECMPEPNKSTAVEALSQSFAVLCESMDQCIAISDDIAPEHLEIQTKDAEAVAKACLNYGGLFIGEHSAEVLGDYGAGPNHTLPTGGTGRYTGGLSVFNFLRIRTWMRVDHPDQCQDMVDDTILMARLEGLEGHARAAETRSLSKTPAFDKK